MIGCGNQNDFLIEAVHFGFVKPDPITLNAEFIVSLLTMLAFSSKNRCVLLILAEHLLLNSAVLKLWDPVIH